MRDLVILGSSGNVLDIVDAVQASPMAYRLVGFLDDNRSVGEVEYGFPVLGPLSADVAPDGCLFVNGIGSPRSYQGKAALIHRLGVSLDRFATVLHPTATISPSARIGRGTVILGNCSVGANVAIGHHVMMLPNCVIGHDSSIGDYVTFAAGVIVSGSVQIGPSAYLGAGSAIRDSVCLGEGALLGLGAALTKNAPAGVVLAGVPARIVRGQGK